MSDDNIVRVIPIIIILISAREEAKNLQPSPPIPFTIELHYDFIIVLGFELVMSSDGVLHAIQA